MRFRQVEDVIKLGNDGGVVRGNAHRLEVRNPLNTAPGEMAGAPATAADAYITLGQLLGLLGQSAPAEYMKCDAQCDITLSGDQYAPPENFICDAHADSEPTTDRFAPVENFICDAECDTTNTGDEEPPENLICDAQSDSTLSGIQYAPIENFVGNAQADSTPGGS